MSKETKDALISAIVIILFTLMMTGMVYSLKKTTYNEVIYGSKE